MLSTAENYTAALLKKIFAATSQEEVKCIIDEAFDLLSLEKEADFVAAFIENSIAALDKFSPMNKDPQQWTNIKMAGVCFNQMKNQLQQAEQHI